MPHHPVCSYRIDDAPSLMRPTAASATSTATWSSCPSGDRIPPSRRFPGPPHPVDPEQGLTQFHLVTGSGVDSGLRRNPDNLEKRTTRAFRRTLFGSMSHLWLFDKRCVEAVQAPTPGIGALPRTVTVPHGTPMGAGAGDLPRRCSSLARCRAELLAITGTC